METQNNYCITKDKDVVYALSAEQLKDIHSSIGYFFRRNKKLVPVFENEVSDMEIVIQKEIELTIQSNVCKVFYNIFTPEGEITYLTYEQTKQLSVLLQAFLAKYSDSENIFEDKILPEVADDVSESIEVEEDAHLAERSGVFQAEVSVGKYIRCSSQETSPEISYSVYANERNLNDLEPFQLYSLYRKLDDFIKCRV